MRDLFKGIDGGCGPEIAFLQTYIEEKIDFASFILFDKLKRILNSIANEILNQTHEHWGPKGEVWIKIF